MSVDRLDAYVVDRLDWIKGRRAAFQADRAKTSSVFPRSLAQVVPSNPAAKAFNAVSDT